MLVQTSQKLNDLLVCAGLKPLLGDITINAICFDSRSCLPQSLFVAIPCARMSQNIHEAVGRGAVVVLVPEGFSETLSVPAIYHANPRQALAHLASAFYPAQPQINVAVTGTNGKSSTVSFLKQFWSDLGHKSATLGTLGLDASTCSGMAASLKMPALTTPDALSLHQALHMFSQGGVTHCAFEASSHGLDQHRLDGVRLSAVGWTNLTQDHLDYHGNLDNYFQAKARLLDLLPDDQPFVVNAKTAFFDVLEKRHRRLISYALEAKATIEARHLRNIDRGLGFELWVDGQSQGEHVIHMAGHFQVENILCALGLAWSLGENLESLCALLPQLKSAQGRMEWVGQTTQGCDIYVDYAHTPDALERALISLRPRVSGKLWLVMGCGGDRDQEKRPLMGNVASLRADGVVVTDDNPRTEDPQIIRKSILQECPSAVEIPDRGEAIAYAIQALAPGDVLLIAGKGHEQGQIIGDRVLPFDDKTCILSILKDAA